MINDDIKRRIDTLLAHCFNDVLVSDDTHWEVDKYNFDVTVQSNLFIMITISSYACRFLVILHVEKNDNIYQYIANCLQIEAEQLDDRQYYEYLKEMCNNLVGTLKRELNVTIGHLGMSTPDNITSESVQYLYDQPCSYKQIFKAKKQESIFFCSLYLYLDTDNMDLVIPDMAEKSIDEESIEQGELELF